MRRREGLRAAGATIVAIAGLVMVGEDNASAQTLGRSTFELVPAKPHGPVSFRQRVTFAPREGQAKPPALRRVVLEFPRGFRFDTSVPDRCEASDEQLMVEGAGACPEASLVGAGTADGLSGSGPPADPARLQVRIFNDGDGVIFLLTFTGTNQTAAVARGRFDGRTLATELPAVPGAPPDGESVLTRLDVRVFEISSGSGSGRRAYAMTPGRCPIRGGWTFRTTFSFADGTTESHQSNVGCRGGRGDFSGWYPLRPSPLSRTEVSAAAVGQDIYVVGGYGNGFDPSAAVERYDTARDRWESVHPLPETLNHASAVSYGGRLYVLGGYTGPPFSLGLGTEDLLGTTLGTGSSGGASRAFYRYEPATDSWSRMPDAPSARAALAVAVVGDSLYAAGGADALQPLTRFEIFDFRTGTWSVAPDLPLATEHVVGAAAGGDFYVIGGRPRYGGGVNSFVQRYDPQTGAWERVADLEQGHAGASAVSVCDRVVVFGGEDPALGYPGTESSVEIYDPDRDAWDQLESMATPRHGLGGAVVGDRVYALEGGHVTLVSASSIVEAMRVPCSDGPPDTKIDKGPKRKTKKRRARFKFSSDEADASFECKLDKKRFVPCTTPHPVKVKRRKHRFLVRAIDSAGTPDPTPARLKWRVVGARSLRSGP